LPRRRWCGDPGKQMMNSLLADHPHRRFNALTGEWVFVSPHRTQRPWQGKVEPVADGNRPSFDPGCYLCPGNERAGGERNPEYDSTYIFTNDFAAFVPHPPGSEADRHPLLRAATHAGECRVICFSPRHDLTLAELPAPQLRRVVDVWAQQVEELGRRWRWVQLFENKGTTMGCSNPHPHGQVWAGDFIPVLPAQESRQQREWIAMHGSPLLLDYAEVELREGERVVAQNEHWLAVVPWWAVWPFEILLLPRRHVLRLPDLSSAERDALAALLQRVLIRYDNLFECPFPYSFGWHGAPHDEEDHRGWQLHAHIHPPLLRSATVRKFMVGYELLAETQRDLTPETAAARLRKAGDEHYLSR
jgi:UDPglucose--hexose-1-phosphate uridylyltransferase